MRMAAGRVAGGADGDQPVQRAVDDERGDAGPGESGEVDVQRVGEVQEQRPRRVGVGGRCLRPADPFGRQLDEAAPQVGIEAGGIGQAERK